MNYGEATTGLSTVNLPLCAEATSVEFLAGLKGINSGAKEKVDGPENLPGYRPR